VLGLVLFTSRAQTWTHAAKGIKPAHGPLLEPTQATKGLESKRGPVLEPDAKGIASARALSRPGLESTQLVHNPGWSGIWSRGNEEEKGEKQVRVTKSRGTKGNNAFGICRGAKAS